MIDQLFVWPKTRRFLRDGPLGPYVDGFARRLVEQGYSLGSTRHQLWLVAKASRWLKGQKLGVVDLNEKRIGEFLRDQYRGGPPFPGEHYDLVVFLAQLRAAGIVPPVRSRARAGPLERLEASFARYLVEERGLAQATITTYLSTARSFLLRTFGQGPIILGHLRPRDVTRFILHHARDHSPRTSQLAVAGLRSLLRFLKRTGETAADLAGCVPTVPNWRFATLPKGLQPGQVKEILKSCDRRTIVGRRNRAILLLLARLGLRAGEVVALTLDDINWEAGEIMIRGKGPRRAKLPLPRDVGEALVAYLRDGRPPCSSRRVFIRAGAPRRGFASSVAICTIVRRALARAGISSPRKGAHLLRHTLAAEMLHRRASLQEIGEILRHRQVDTTAIYTKVDVDALRALARPWPGGVT